MTEAGIRGDDAVRADHIVSSALACAETMAWRAIGLRDIAAQADCTAAEIVAVFPGKTAVLAGISPMVDRSVLKGGDTERDEPVRDRLFDVLMRRFDALNMQRAGVLSVLQHLRRMPFEGLQLLPGLDTSMRVSLELAWIDSAGPLGAMRRRVLGLAYLSTVRAWTADDSEDMGKTMAALDKALNRLEQVAASVRVPWPPFARRSGGVSSGTNEEQGTGADTPPAGDSDD